MPSLEQTMQAFQYRIVRDPRNPKLWAYEVLEHDRYCEPVGGFQTQKKAKRAAKRKLL